jgi:putative transposase
VPKWQKRLPGFEQKIIAMYARGLSVRDIQAILEVQYRIEVSPAFISTVTDAVHAEVSEWQNRPLEKMTRSRGPMLRETSRRRARRVREP